jgi:hypothetical protein
MSTEPWSLRTLVADLVEPAKSTGLEKLREGKPALDIAVRWLRPKFERALVPVPDDAVTMTPCGRCLAGSGPTR